MLLFVLVCVSLCFSRILHDTKNGKWGPDNATHISGYITVNESWHEGTHLFFNFFEAREKPENSPFIVWFTGGPGCSGQSALLTENGPYYLNNDSVLEINPYSWNSVANIMWVDQPASTGYSYVDHLLDYDFNEDQVSRDMWNFLQEFMNLYPKYKNMDLYLIGESYGGHYIPAVGAKVFEENKAGKGIHLNLKGIGIGNGMVDPYHQYPAYAEFAATYNLISDEEYKKDKKKSEKCDKLIRSGLWPVSLADCLLYSSAVEKQISKTVGYKINRYNWKIPCYGALCYDDSKVTTYLNLESTKDVLGVKPGMVWKEMNRDVFVAMLGDWMNNLEAKLPNLLENGIRVLVYSGELDYICNWKGGEAWTTKMKWSGQSSFNAISYSPWYVDGEEAGSFKTYESLTFLRVKDAGHMVPFDQPKNSLDMLKRFLDDTPFSKFVPVPSASESAP